MEIKFLRMRIEILNIVLIFEELSYELSRNHDQALLLLLVFKYMQILSGLDIEFIDFSRECVNETRNIVVIFT